MCFFDFFDMGHSKCFEPKCEKKEYKDECQHKCWECFVKCCPCKCGDYHKKDDCKCPCHEQKGYSSSKSMYDMHKQMDYGKKDHCKQHEGKYWGKKTSPCCKPCSKMHGKKEDEDGYKIHQPAYCPLICPKNFDNYSPDFWEKGFDY